MDRGASAAFLAELAKQQNQPFHLFELQLDSGTIYATDAARDIEWGGNTYPALSHFLEFSGIRETTELQVSLCTVALSGVDQTLISAVLNEDYIDRRLVIYKGFLSEDVWLDLPGVAGNYASTPDAAKISVTGDIDIRVKVALDDWTPSEIKALVSKRLTTGNQRTFQFVVNTNGTIRLFTSPDGITEDSAQTSSVATGFSDGSTHWLRVTRSAASGALNYYTSEDGSTWTLLGSANRTSTPGNLFDSSRPLVLGALQNGTTQMFAGQIYRAQVYNGIDGALVADFDPSRFAVGSLSAQMQTGETWSIEQSSGSPPNLPAQIIHDIHRVVVDPIALFDGRCDEPTITENPEDGTCTVSVDAASHWVDFERRPGRHTNHEEQQIYFSGDMGFEFVSELSKPVIWGRGVGAAPTKGGVGQEVGGDGSGRFGIRRGNDGRVSGTGRGRDFD